MIALIVEGTRVAMKADSSFSLVVENREFDDRDSYSLNIDLPLKDCPENVAVFGRLLSPNIPMETIRLDATLVLGPWIRNGVVTVVAVSKDSVSVQFLEGRSALNFDRTLDKVYINELDLGGYSDMTNRENFTPFQAWGRTTGTWVFNYVAIPWVSDNSGIKYNDVEYVDGQWQWKDPIAPEDPDEETYSQDWITLERSRRLTWQPSLLFLTKKICQAAGLSYDFSKWEGSHRRMLMVCNTLPPVYDLFGWADILPHWTVKEYFANLEPLMQGYFDIDLAAMSVVFVPFDPEEKEYTEITDSQLLAEFSADVAPEEKSAKYRANKNLKYADSSDKMWPLMTCGKALASWPKSRVMEYTSPLAMAAIRNMYKTTDFTSADSHRGQKTPLDSLIHIVSSAMDIYLALYAIRKEKVIVSYFDRLYLTWKYTNTLQPVGRFAPLVRNDIEDGDDTEIQFVPVAVKSVYPDFLAMFIPFSQLNEEKADPQFYAEGEDDSELRQTSVVNTLEKEESDKQVFFDRIFVGYYPGYNNDFYKIDKVAPYPVTDSVVPVWTTSVNAEGSIFSYRVSPDQRLSLRLADVAAEESKLRIDPKTKYKFRFLSESIPEVRDIFLIKGRRFICEKMTVSFSMNGKSEIIEGEFYPVDESS